MTNLYLPKSSGETTEIDLIMLSEKGIYVFESKNYSGWIFGDEKNKNWTQTLQNKKKNRFYNPIWQNKGHINALKAVSGIDKDNFYKSFIIFSERCTLKKINVTSSNVKVIKRTQLIRAIKEDMNNSPNLMIREEVDKLYFKLQNYTHANDFIKRIHVENIKAKRL
jgi:Nuclease-related domain